MSLNFKLKQLAVLLGDILLFYGALVITLILRYGHPGWIESFEAHLKPFSWALIVWLLIFYLADLYQVKILKNDVNLIGNLFWAVIIATILSVMLFYVLAPVSKLTPKTNLLIFGAVFGILSYFWRLLIANVLIFGGWRYRVLIIGDSPRIQETVAYLKANPTLGYDIVLWLKENREIDRQNLPKIISENKIDTIVLPPQIKKELAIAESIYRLLPLKLAITDFVTFYETIFVKIPLEELEEAWFIEKIITKRPLFDAIKRLTDIILSIISIIVLLPIFIVIAVLIKFSSRGPVIFKQQRMGKNDKIFWLYKFRTMMVEVEGPLWTIENDRRLTPVGKVLRFSHLDEFPQLLNIIKGDIAFVGPRAERIELVEKYKKLPYYEIRHIIKPGFTGWAQIYYRPSASLEEAFEKLKYDIYYIKNRSLFLDALIIFKTIKYLFTKVK
ncbi:MAG: exopolysaccharide biosynthesis polyprenyl glycosylphosphotransferase [Candidatus Paceibacterota bacterium]